MKRWTAISFLVFAAWIAPLSGAQREFLTPVEIDSVRDEQDYGKRVILYLSFAHRRVEAVRSELESKDPDAGKRVQKHLSEFNSILGAVNDSLDAARERRASADKAVKALETEATNFLRYLTSLRDSAPPTIADFRFTLDEAIDVAQEELEEVEKGAFPEVQERTPPIDLPSSPPPRPKGDSEPGPPRKSRNSNSR